VNKLNKRPQTADMGCPLSLGVGRGPNNPHRKKNKHVTNLLREPRTWANSLGKRPKLYVILHLEHNKSI
jgi:hypothetical protein